MVRIVVLLLALMACKRDRTDAVAVEIETCLAEVTEAAMSTSCKAAVTEASKQPKLSAKARAVLQRWLQLDANLTTGTIDPRARSARDRHLVEVREIALPELARHPD